MGLSILYETNLAVNLWLSAYYMEKNLAVDLWLNMGISILYEQI